MIRILIADDENMIRKRLEQCLPWDEMGYEVIGTASDGEELLNMITELRADVVLTDIKMPGMDGLKVIERVRSLGFEDIKFVIISGYSDFEYARKGIEFRVFDYVLKPIDKERLIECLKKLAVEVKGLKTKRKEQIRSIIKDKYDELGLSGVLIRIYKDEIPHRKNEDVRSIINMCMVEILMDYCVIDETNEYITIFYETASDENLLQLLFELFYCINDGMENTDENYAVSLYYTGILKCSEDMRKCMELFDKSVKKRAYIGKRRFVNVNGIENIVEPDGNFILDNDIQENLEKCIADEDFERIRELFIKLPLEDLAYNNAKSVCFLFVNMLYRYLNSEHQATDEKKDIINDFLHEFEVCEFIETIKQVAMDCIEKLIETSSDRSKLETSGGNYIIKKAMLYIDENLERDISLRDVADSFEVSYGYISRLFNRSFSGGFVSVLRQKRIEMAKKMLTDTNKKIYEIAYATGFKNGRYFSEVFKNEVGITPQEYRNKNV